MRPRLISLVVALASATVTLTATAQAALNFSHLIPFLRTVSTPPS